MNPLVKSIVPDDPSYLAALHLALEQPYTPARSPSESISRLLDRVSRGQVDVDLMAGPFNHPRTADMASTGRRLSVGGERMTRAGPGPLHVAGLCVVSPGAAGLVFLGSHKGAPTDPAIPFEVVGQLVSRSFSKGVRVLQALTDPSAPTADRRSQVLRAAGFRRVTRLVYLTVEPGSSVSSFGSTGAPGLEWLPYSPTTHQEFARTVEESYTGTLDCPELSGVRTLEQVLDGYRASGCSGAELWRMAIGGGVPAGVVLINRLEDTTALEVVYLGVVSGQRRRGVGTALVRRVLEMGRELSAEFVTLAVDERNLPALQLYARGGFVRRVSRDAWIALPPPRGS